jgi:transposase
VQELKELQRQGVSIQAISELTGWDRKTIRKYVQAAGWCRNTAHVLHDQASSMRLSHICGNG